VRPQRTGTEAYYKDPSGTTATSQHATQNGAKQLVVGVDANGAAVALDPEALTRHTAVLGSTGSGKTTLILSFVEQLAMLGVPSILVDRKGDFAAYANDSCWSAPLAKGAGRAPETITQSS
jgi:Ni2+-binding GTPase involved in maturation of urease and hydrogenase